MASCGVTGWTAEGQRALQGQLIHRELVGVDQPLVSRESTETTLSLHSCHGGRSPHSSVFGPQCMGHTGR